MNGIITQIVETGYRNEVGVGEYNNVAATASTDANCM